MFPVSFEGSANAQSSNGVSALANHLRELAFPCSAKESDEERAVAIVGLANVSSAHILFLVSRLLPIILTHARCIVFNSAVARRWHLH